MSLQVVIWRLADEHAKRVYKADILLNGVVVASGEDKLYIAAALRDDPEWVTNVTGVAKARAVARAWTALAEQVNADHTEDQSETT